MLIQKAKVESTKEELFTAKENVKLHRVKLEEELVELLVMGVYERMNVIIGEQWDESLEKVKKKIQGAKVKWKEAITDRQQCLLDGGARVRVGGQDTYIASEFKIAPPLRMKDIYRDRG